MYDVIFRVSGQTFKGRLNIGIDGKGRRRLYDLTKIKNLEPGLEVSQHGGVAAPTSTQDSENILRPNTGNINAETGVHTEINFEKT